MEHFDLARIENLKPRGMANEKKRFSEGHFLSKLLTQRDLNHKTANKKTTQNKKKDEKRNAFDVNSSRDVAFIVCSEQEEV